MCSFQVGTSVLCEAFVNLPSSKMLGVLVIAVTAGGILCFLRMRSPGLLNQGLRVDYLRNALVIMPLDHWSTITKKGLALAVQLKGQIRIVHVDADDSREEFECLWQRNVVTPLEDADRTVPELVVLSSPKGYVLQPIAEYILDIERDEPDRQIIVVFPKIAVRYWWQKPLHNHRSRMLKLILSTFGSQRIMIIDVPWYL